MPSSLTPEPMVRLWAVVPAKDAREAFEVLGELELLHLIREEAGPETAPLVSATVGVAWNGYLERVERLRGALGIPVTPTHRESPPGGSLAVMEQGLYAMEVRGGELLGRREEGVRRQEALADQVGRLQSYLGLGLSLDRVGKGSFLQILLGTVPESRFDLLQKSLGGEAILLRLPTWEGRRGVWAKEGGGGSPFLGRQPLVLLGARQEVRAREGLLQEMGFQEEPLPCEGMLDAFVERMDREVEQGAQALVRLEAEIQAFTKEIARPLADLERWIIRERSLMGAEAHFPRTATTVLLQGWLPAAEAPVLTERLLKATGGRCVLELSPPGKEDEDKVPVLLRPSAILRPFGKLVEGYGLPRYRELSPTLFVAVSYLLMFGMMFGDVGHGAILALIGLGVILFPGGFAVFAAPARRDVGLLLLGGGISSALFGAVYGSCFGLARFKAFALWHDPLEGNPLHLMALAIGLGVIMISLGLVLNMLNRIRRRDVLGAFMDRFGLAGLLFYWGALGTLFWQGRLPWILPALLLLAVAAWVLREPIQEALLRSDAAWGHRFVREQAVPPHRVDFTGAFVEAFETLLVYLANTISFVRLAAYAMSHAALLAATFLMAEAVTRPGGGVGFSYWLVIIIGNLVAICLEGVIAAVQALRLEYYEFFGKFFSGAGRPFEPFRLS